MLFLFHSPNLPFPPHPQSEILQPLHPKINMVTEFNKLTCRISNYLWIIMVLLFPRTQWGTRLKILRSVRAHYITSSAERSLNSQSRAAPPSTQFRVTSQVSEGTSKWTHYRSYRGPKVINYLKVARDDIRFQHNANVAFLNFKSGFCVWTLAWIRWDCWWWELISCYLPWNV